MQFHPLAISSHSILREKEDNSKKESCIEKLCTFEKKRTKSCWFQHIFLPKFYFCRREEKKNRKHTMKGSELGNTI